jgi:hypothetical protein
VSRTAQHTWCQLQQQSAQARRGLDELVRALETLAGGAEVADAISGATVLDAELSAWEQVAGPALVRVRELLAGLQRAREEQLSSFGQRLGRALQAQQHDVHGETSPLIVDGVVHVEVSPEQGVVRVNGEADSDCSCAEVAARVEAELRRLRKLATPPATLLEQIQTAYDEECCVRRLEPGTQVETLAVLYRVALLRQQAGFRRNPTAKSFREYPREVFRADLFALLQSGALAGRGRRLRYASGSDTAGAIFMLVPALGRAAHVGRIWFEPAGD